MNVWRCTDLQTLNLHHYQLFKKYLNTRRFTKLSKHRLTLYLTFWHMCTVHFIEFYCVIQQVHKNVSILIYFYSTPTCFDTSVLLSGSCSEYWSYKPIDPLNPELNPICYLLALLGAHHFLHFRRIRVKLLTFRLLMSYIYIYIYIYIWSTHSWCF